MSRLLEDLRDELRRRGHQVIDLGVDGLGIEFSDGCDVWWVLPGDPLSSVVMLAKSDKDVESIVGGFERLNVMRSQAILAVRHHLARRRFRVLRVRNGQWPIQTETGGVSSGVSVGASLTAALVMSGNVVEAVRGVFTSSIAGQPSTRRVERDLSTMGDPADELVWPANEGDAGVSFSPLSVLGLIGVCKAIDFCARAADDGRMPTAEELVEAAQPKGRIGQAPVRFAAAPPDASASYEIAGKTFDVEFDDRLDCFRISPRSRELAGLVGRHGPEAAGDRLLADFRRLTADRARVVTALRLGLPALGYRVQDEGKKLHFGRKTREATVDVGKALTEALRSGSVTEAVRRALPTHPKLAEDVIAALPSEAPATVPNPVKDVLAPPRPCTWFCRQSRSGIGTAWIRWQRRSLRNGLGIEMY